MTDETKATNSPKPKILADHRQVGKRFIPPMLDVGVFEAAKWREMILPEVLWIGLLNNANGFRLGGELSLDVARAAVNSFTDQKPQVLFAGASSFSTLDQTQQSRMVDELESKSKILPLRNSLATLAFYYPTFPLRFLFRDQELHEDSNHVNLASLKILLESLFNRWETPATMVQANVVYIAFVTGKLHVKKGLALENFPAIQDFPRTQESKRIAGSVRAFVSAYFGHLGGQRVSAWPKTFWNRGLEIEKCSPYEG